MNDAIASGLLDELNEINVRVSKDVAVVGMGDLAVSRYGGIHLTTVHEPLEEMGSSAAEVVLKLIENPTHPPVHRKITCNELKIRRTSAFLPYSKKKLSQI